MATLALPRLPLLTLAALALGSAALIGARPALASHEDCVLIVDPPTLYAGMVFPLSRIECATTKNQMRLTVSLTRDGVEVSRFTRNDCRKLTVCHADVGATALDVAGDQEWCTVAWGSIHGHALPIATACEEEEF